MINFSKISDLKTMLRSIFNLPIENILKILSDNSLSQIGSEKWLRSKVMYLYAIQNRLNDREVKLIYSPWFRPIYLSDSDILDQSKDEYDILSAIPDGFNFSEYRSKIYKVECFTTPIDFDLSNINSSSIVNKHLEKRGLKFHKVDKQIGHGAFGNVYVACCNDNCNFILKEMKITNRLAEEGVNNEIRYGQYMGDLGIGPVVYDYELDYQNKYASLVMDKLDITFNEYIHQLINDKKINFDPSNWGNVKMDFTNNKISVLFYIRLDEHDIIKNDINDIVLLLNMMHKIGLYHNDMSHFGNIMRSRDGIWKLVDFGLTSTMNGKYSLPVDDSFSTRKYGLYLDVNRMINIEDCIGKHNYGKYIIYYGAAKSLICACTIMRHIASRCQSISPVEYIENQYYYRIMYNDETYQCPIMWIEDSTRKKEDSCIFRYVIHNMEEYEINPTASIIPEYSELKSYINKFYEENFGEKIIWYRS